MGGSTSRIAAAHSAAAQLTALTGTQPRTTAEPAGALRVEVEVTPALSAQWVRLLPLFDLCDQFGLTDTSTGQILWLYFLGEGTRP